MKKSEFLRRRINVSIFRQREPGQIGWCIGLFFLLFFVILLYTQIQVEQYKNISLYLEDALAASNLASAVIDVEQYGISHDIYLSDPLQAYDICREAIRTNLNLDANWENSNKGMIAGKVSLVNYVIYNVKEEQVIACHVNERRELSYEEGKLGVMRAPNNEPVEGTGIYSEITFPTEGIFGVKVNAHKGKLVDIQRRDNGE